MADAKVDKSLDDIIKERKISSRGPRRGGNRGMGGPRRSAGGNQGGRGGGGGNRQFGRRSLGGVSGAVQKRRSGPGSLNGSPNKAAAAAASINGQWDHDLYRRSSAGTSAANISSKLSVANLDFGVNDQDIKGLFQEFGNIRRAAVHYDRSGRSLGTAEVIFERRADAIRALKKYNGVSLDGRPMDIQLVAPLTAVVPPAAASSSGGPPRRSGNGGGRSRSGGFIPRRRGGAANGGGGAGGNRGGRREQKPQRSAADLDAELDAYNAKMQTD